MNRKVILPILIFVYIAVFMPMASARADVRGQYIYCDSDCPSYMTLDTKLALSSLLWRIDDKTGYEMVYYFPNKELNEEEMTVWYNQHGVGKKGLDNGFAAFFPPRYKAFAMFGERNDKIDIPYTSTMGGRALKGMEKEPVRAILNFTNTVNKKFDKPSVFERPPDVAKGIKVNLDIISLLAAGLAFLALWYNLRDGFQPRDLVLPIALLVLVFVIFGLAYVGSEYAPTIQDEFGIITATKPDHRIYTDRHCDSKGKNCRTEVHTVYYNDVKIKSYDFRVYAYRFESTDNKWPTRINPGDFAALSINIQNNHLSGASVPIRYNSGGKTVGWGTWVKTT